MSLCIGTHRFQRSNRQSHRRSIGFTLCFFPSRLGNFATLAPCKRSIFTHTSRISDKRRLKRADDFYTARPLRPHCFTYYNAWGNQKFDQLIYFFFPAQDLQSQLVHLQPPGFLAQLQTGWQEGQGFLPGQDLQSQLSVHEHFPVLEHSQDLVHLEQHPFLETEPSFAAAITMRAAPATAPAAMTAIYMIRM